VARQRIQLRGISPQLEAKAWESNTRLTVGRLAQCDVVLDHFSVSRHHAEVVGTDHGWVVRDLGSTNGTAVNGVPVGPAERVLRARDVLQFGTMSLVVAALDDVPLAAVPTPTGGEGPAALSWEQRLSALQICDGLAQPGPGDWLLLLTRAGRHLSQITALDDLLRSLLEDAVAALNAQHGAIGLVDEATGQIQLRAVCSRLDGPGGEVFYSQSMAQRSLRQGETLLCRDSREDRELEARPSVRLGKMVSLLCAVLRTPRKRLGVLHLDRGPNQEPFGPDDYRLANILAATIASAIETTQLLEGQREFFLQTVNLLGQTIELRDQYTGDHTQRVTDYALLLANELRLGEDDRRSLRLGAPLHDLGKIAVDDAILRKPGRLTADEFEAMKKHTVKGAAILHAIPDLAPARPIVRSHHERWDGAGYPDRLAGEQIPVLARVVAVADAFDAMTSDRPYRARLQPEAAFAQVRDEAGRQFDPACAQAFLRLRPQVEKILRHRMRPVAPAGLDEYNPDRSADSTVQLASRATG
jgi:HD-GYP domain-containing protein (c-di-GMP phosphodiesterase class II)